MPNTENTKREFPDYAVVITDDARQCLCCLQEDGASTSSADIPSVNLEQLLTQARILPRCDANRILAALFPEDF